MKKESLGEGIANAVSHGAGVVVALIALIILVIRADSNLAVVGSIVFALSMMLLYLSSTLYHAFPQTMRRVFSVFQRFDHSAIYVLIAGTYTPYILIRVPSTETILLLIALWVIAVFGIVFKSIWIDRFKFVHLFLYLLMGWSGVLFWEKTFQMMPTLALAFLIAGGLSYTVGVVFYLSKFRYTHLVWHLFVLSGSLLHFLSIYQLL